MITQTGNPRRKAPSALAAPNSCSLSAKSNDLSILRRRDGVKPGQARQIVRTLVLAPSYHHPVWQYLRHQRTTIRPDDGALDIGALESGTVFADDFETGSTGAWANVAP